MAWYDDEKLDRYRRKKGMGVNRSGKRMENRSKYRADQYKSETPHRTRQGKTAENLSKNPRQVRARLRRAHRTIEEDYEQLYKPVSQWDFEELERGRPRNSQGNFAGAAPKWLSRDLHSKIIERYKSLVREEMSKKAPSALKLIQYVLENNDLDDNGKPVISPSTRLQAAQMVIEQLIGKPRQEVKQDVSMELRALLGHVMVSPGELSDNDRVVRGQPALHSAAIDEVEEGEVLEEYEVDDEIDEEDRW